MSIQQIVKAVHDKGNEVMAPLTLEWRYAAGPAAAAHRPAPKAFKPLPPAAPLALTPRQKHWFSAEFAFPAAAFGLPLQGKQAYVYIFPMCPFTLWLDGRETYREEHAWYATGPIADPLVLSIEPGRMHKLLVCLEPQTPSHEFSAGTIQVKPLPCIETAVDVRAVACELEFAAGFARTAGERRLIDRAAAALDLSSLARHRWQPFLASAREMERLLQPFAGRAKEMTVHILGYSHIDMDWRWNHADTVACTRRDFKAVTQLLDDVPEMRFSMSQIPTYAIVRQKDPAVFAQVRRLIAQGRWENLAAAWVEGDLAMADGEAIARHMLYAADWSDRRLGSRAEILWVPDNFSHPGNMPQMARLGGCHTYFHWRCNPASPDNWPARVWRGADGTEVLAVSSAYGGSLLPGTEMYSLFHAPLQAQKLGLNTAHTVWGLGDHGGGLPRHLLTLFARYRNWPLMPAFRFSTAGDLVADLRKELHKLPHNTAETFPLFEGCFTTTRRMKWYNRKSEGALLTAEALAAIAGLDRNRKLRDAWKGVLFSQFHDILCGCAVGESYRDAFARGRGAIRTAEAVSRQACRALSGPPGNRLTVVNPLGFACGEIVRTPLPAAVRSLIDVDGKTVPIQRYGDECVFLAADLPAFSSKSYSLSAAPAAEAAASLSEDDRFFTVDTAHYQAKLNKASGVIGSFYDKGLQRELVGYGVPKHLSHVYSVRSELALNVFQVLQESHNDMTAWLIHDVKSEQSLLSGAKVRRVATGPVFTQFHVRHAFGASRIDEDIFFYHQLNRVDFHVQVDWHEKGSPQTGVPALKLSFATAATATTARFEGPYTIAEHPADGQERPTQKWTDVTGRDFGFTVYNDSTYGCDVLGPRLRLSLVRNAYNPEPDSDGGRHQMCFSFRPHGPRISNAQLVKNGLSFNRPPVAARSGPSACPCEPLISIDSSSSVVCTAARRAEHSDGLVVRLFETAGAPARVTVRAARNLHHAQEVNLIEDPISKDLLKAGGMVRLTLRPFEIKTLLLRR